MDTNIKISPTIEANFKKYISNRCGLYFKDHDLNHLKRAIRERLLKGNYKSAESYYNYLVNSEAHESDEFRELLNLLTINHTYFFRNEGHFKALREKVLPDIIQKNMLAAQEQGVKPSLNIWSAGCSSGEEPYSIAILLKELILDISNWDITIYATDVSTNALQRAKEGIYHKNVVKNINNNIIKRYFMEKEEFKSSLRVRQFILRNEVKNMVQFEFFNLMNPSYPVGFDIIFCRNVVIYFDLPVIIEIMKKFYLSLKVDGYFFIGYSESLQFISDKFKMEEYSDAIFYRKQFATKSVEDFKKSTAEQVEHIFEDVARAQVEANKEVEVSEKVRPKKAMKDLLVKIIKSVHLKRYNEALYHLEEAKKINARDIDLYYLSAEVYANQGEFKKAEKELRKLIHIDALFPPAYYLLSTIFLEDNNIEEARDCLKKVLYLEKDFPLAHFNLAMLYRKDHRIDDSIREFRNTFDCLSEYSPERIIAYSDGFTAATLRNICKSNLERLREGSDEEEIDIF